MAETMKLQVITPDKEFFHGDVSMVELNTADGELGVYPAIWRYFALFPTLFE